MHEDWNELERNPSWEPGISRSDASLDLCQYLTGFRSTALQLDRHHPGRIESFAAEQIVAPFLIVRDWQRVAFLHIDNHTHRRHACQTNPTKPFPLQ